MGNYSQTCAFTCCINRQKMGTQCLCIVQNDFFIHFCTTYIWRTYISHVIVNKHSTTQLNISFFFEIHNPRVVQCREMDNTYKGLIVSSAVARDKTPVSVTTLLTNANYFLIWKIWHANQVGVKKQQLIGFILCILYYDQIVIFYVFYVLFVCICICLTHMGVLCK